MRVKSVLYPWLLVSAMRIEDDSGDITNADNMDTKEALISKKLSFPPLDFMRKPSTNIDHHGLGA